MKTIVDDTLELCHQRFKNHSVELRLIAFDKNTEIECRAVEISQVLLNLLNNAYDSVIEQEERWIEISFKNTGDFVQLIVRDSGQPIPEDIRNRIMSPFFTTKPAGKGTGLGLSISTRIAQTHSGTLELDCKDTHPKFVLTLPNRIDLSSIMKNVAS